MFALGIVYVYHLILFAPILVLTDGAYAPKASVRVGDAGFAASSGVKAEKTAPANGALDAIGDDHEQSAQLLKAQRRFESSHIRKFTNLLTHPAFVIITLLLLVVYWAVFTYYAIQFRPSIDAAQILPAYSRIQRPNSLLYDRVWYTYQPVSRSFC